MKKLLIGLALGAFALGALALGENYSVSNPPPETPCGAGGIGLNGKTKLPQVRDAVPGRHVGKDGFWATCKMPPDCPEMKPVEWGARCVSPHGIPASYIGRTHQRQSFLPPPASVVHGRIYLRCTSIGNGQAAWLDNSKPGAMTYCK